MLTFLKAQTSSLIASAADFLITVLLVELTGTRIILASVEGTLSGGIINFIINRYWVFSGGEKKKRVQIFRYTMVWTGNLALNASGMYLVTHYTDLNYIVSKIFISVLVGVLYNYFLQKRFVFK
ncbi:MAG TPA: GtrA family protein [Chitinophagaceae bacterium]|nr:GtrA family protein [Chitinophagaceae bacterium]